MPLLDRPNFRQARSGDLERILELETHSFPAPLSRAERERSITQNPLGTLKDFIVGEIGGEIVAQAFLFPLVTFWGGRPVKTGGVAFVAVAPEARGRGVASAMLDHIHLRATRKGMPLTMLYAFRQGFYARLGYVTTSSKKRLDFDPRSVPKAWRGRVRRATGRDRAWMERLFDHVAKARSGVHRRPRAFWDRFFARETTVLLVTEDASGYVAFDLDQTEPHAETSLVVRELVAANAPARRTLVGALGAVGDQASRIIYEVAEDDPIAQVLVDADGRRFGTADVEHRLGDVVGGPMVRIGDVAAAVEARGYLADGAFTLDVDGDAFGVRVRDGRASVTTKARGPRLTTTRAGLTAILYGGVSVEDAAALGLADASSSDLTTLLRLPSVLPFDAF